MTPRAKAVTTAQRLVTLLGQQRAENAVRQQIRKCEQACIGKPHEAKEWKELTFWTMVRRWFT